MKIAHARAFTACSVLLSLNTVRASSNGTATESPQPHWDYEGENGAEGWESVSNAFSKCEEGRTQSPLNLNDPEVQGVVNANVTAAALSVRWPDCNGSLNLTNNGHTLQLGPFPQTEECRTLTTYQGQNFTLQQIHFHTPSEHHVGGDFFPMEVHLVHKATDSNKLMVLGVLYNVTQQQAGRTNALVNAVSPVAVSRVTQPNQIIAIQGALPLQSIPRDTNNFRQGFWTYAGSLTTPPCTEGVSWVVAKDQLLMTVDQWNQMKDVMGYNARPTQGRDQETLAQSMFGNGAVSDVSVASAIAVVGGSLLASVMALF